jgi:hypothetical protein
MTAASAWMPWGPAGTRARLAPPRTRFVFLPSARGYFLTEDLTDRTVGNVSFTE